jgi:hypothetical protein
MMKRMVFAALMCMAVFSGLAQDGPVALSAQSTEKSQNPEQLKARLLERMARMPPTDRGDNNARLKWEWYDGIVRSYLYEKSAITRPLGAS